MATGSSPRRDGFQLATPVTPVPGHDLPHVFTSWDVFGFGGRARLEGPAVVFDDTGTFEAISVADALLEAGLKVTHDRPQPGHRREPALPAGHRRRRHGSGCCRATSTSSAATTCRASRPTRSIIGVPFTERVRAVPARTVVLVTYNHPNRELAEYLAAEGEPPVERAPRRRRDRYERHPPGHPPGRGSRPGHLSPGIGTSRRGAGRTYAPMAGPEREAQEREVAEALVDGAAVVARDQQGGPAGCGQRRGRRQGPADPPASGRRQGRDELHVHVVRRRRTPTPCRSAHRRGTRPSAASPARRAPVPAGGSRAGTAAGPARGSRGQGRLPVPAVVASVTGRISKPSIESSRTGPAGRNMSGG